jgi:hypothetical protein
MFMDAQARPSNNQSLAVAAGTTVSTDTIDLLTASDNPGRGGIPLRAIAVVTTALAGGTSVQAQLIESANANLSSPTVLASGPVVPLASATLGAKLLDVPLPDTSQRYIGFQYVTVGVHSAGGVTAGIVGGTDRNVTTIPMNTGL